MRGPFFALLLPTAEWFLYEPMSPSRCGLALLLQMLLNEAEKLHPDLKPYGDPSGHMSQPVQTAEVTLPIHIEVFVLLRLLHGWDLLKPDFYFALQIILD